jgi:DNA-binding MarR family transcriptional regulator
MKKKTNAEIGMEKERNAVAIHRRIANVLSEEKRRMENEGLKVPSISVYVKGDDRPLWKPEKYFNKNFKSYLQQIKRIHGLSVTEIGIITILSYHITYENNLITNEDGTPMIKKDLEEVLGIRQNAIDKYLAALVKKGAFASVKVKRSVNYYLNPRITYQGNRIDSTLLSMFHIRDS